MSSDPWPPPTRPFDLTTPSACSRSSGTAAASARRVASWRSAPDRGRRRGGAPATGRAAAGGLAHRAGDVGAVEASEAVVEELPPRLGPATRVEVIVAAFEDVELA